MGSVIITSNDTLIECVCSLIPQGYKDFVDRQDTRQEAWHMPGWDECVLRTGIVLMSLCVCVYRCVVPLIRHMESKILVPTSYSPLQ